MATVVPLNYCIVYAKPKHMLIDLKVSCKCGVKTSEKIRIDSYAKIHIGCTSCGENGTHTVNRATIVKWYMVHRTGSLSDLPYFLGSWENEMRDRRAKS